MPGVYGKHLALVREITTIARRAGFAREGRPNWAALAHAAGVDEAQLKAVIASGAQAGINALDDVVTALCLFTRGFIPSYNDVYLLVASGFLTQRDILDYFAERNHRPQA
jgi:hypothetical protein